MSRKKKTQRNTGGEIGFLIIGGIAAAVSFLSANLWIIFTVIGCVVVGVIGMGISKSIKRAKYLKWYYDKERRLSELVTANCIDEELTARINEAQTSGARVQIEGNSPDFDNWSDFQSKMLQSQEVVEEGEVSLGAHDYRRALSGSFGVTASVKPIVLSFSDGYAFYLLPSTILAFVEGDERSVFLCAIKPSALTVSYQDRSKKVQKIIMDTSHRNPRAYDRSNPTDAEIMSSHWQTALKSDGVSRSFQGGLKPENNPLIFVLRYGQITVQIGKRSATSVYSRCRPVQGLVLGLTEYAKQEPAISQEEVKKKVPLPQKERVMAEPSTPLVATKPPEVDFSPVVIHMPDVSSEPATEPDEILDSPLSESDVRHRNKRIATRVCEKLNERYSWEFKVWQAKKARDRWQYHDACIFAAAKSKDGDVAYTVEFNLKTQLHSMENLIECVIYPSKPSTLDMLKSRFTHLMDSIGMQENEVGIGAVLSHNNISNDEQTIITLYTQDAFSLMDEYFYNA
ncbi:hypothetical protein LJC34_06235 [Oscillospiraceae bacterium OttesenSCG-928-G22]|nr:hypothetical protein [Oscillospiraceae bacterium OttesenSCG-928-G22]